jgi:hypothetical protein
MGSGATSLTRAHLSDLQSSASFSRPFAAYGQSKAKARDAVLRFELDRWLRGSWIRHRASWHIRAAAPMASSPQRSGVIDPLRPGAFSLHSSHPSVAERPRVWSSGAATDPLDASWRQYWAHVGLAAPPVLQKPAVVVSSSSAASGFHLWTTASEKLVGQKSSRSRSCRTSWANLPVSSAIFAPAPAPLTAAA